MIDLHMHTTASDGKYTSAELLQMCEQVGLEMISITDHFSVNGYDALQDPAVRSLYSGKILTGCEFSAHFNRQGIEILGYGIDLEKAKQFCTIYPPLKEKNKMELELLIREYRARGFKFEEQQVRKNFENGDYARLAVWNELCKYPENTAQFTNPASNDSAAVFSRLEYANINSPYFIGTDWFAPSAEEVCSFIRSVGGKSIVAHPGSYSSSVYDAIEELILTAKPDGLEAWYSTHKPEQRAYLLALCEKHDLIYSGGSDYHNKDREKCGNALGIPQLAPIFPVAEICKWAEPLKKI